MNKQVSTKAIDEIIRDPKKIERFTAICDNRNGDNEMEYCLRFAYSCYTLAKLDSEHRIKFAKFNELNKDTTADFGYLLDSISKNENFKSYSFKANPILELYEALLRENWDLIKKDRDAFNSVDAFNYTSEHNIKICNAIVQFLQDYVISKSNDLTV